MASMRFPLWSKAGATDAERFDHRLTDSEFVDENEFVRLVGAGNVAGATDDRRNARGLEKAGFGAVADRGKCLLARKVLHQRDEWRIGGERKPRIGAHFAPLN